MASLSPTLQIVLLLLGVLFISFTIVLITIAVVVRRILLRMHHLMMDMDYLPTDTTNEANELLTRAKTEVSPLMRFALALSGALLLRQSHYTSQHKRHVTRANRM